MRGNKNKFLIVLASLLFLVANTRAFDLGALSGIDISGAIDAGVDVFKATTLTESQVIEVSAQAAIEMDSQNVIADSSSSYAKRLAFVTDGFSSVNGVPLNFKVYINDTPNAFAMADGTIRVYSGLMDLLDDDELLFVIGHEVGHIQAGHTAEKMRLAYSASAARKGLALSDGLAGQLAGSGLGMLTEQFVNAQFSQSEELEADQLGLGLLYTSGYDRSNAVSALSKLGAEAGGQGGFFSSHPSPNDRVAKIMGH